MPACTTLGIVSSVDSKRRTDYFQRRKVGSIRDNPKLLKIRQHFENASKDPVEKQTHRNEVGSAPSSINLSRSSGPVVLEELLKINARFSDKTEAFLKSNLDVFSNRRNSEGDLKSRSSFSVAYENAPKINSDGSKSNRPARSSAGFCNGSSNSSVSSGTESISQSLLPPFEIKKDSFNARYNSQNSSESGVHTSSPTSEEDNLSSNSRTLFVPEVDKSSNKFFRAAKDDAPPIPRRGISPAVQNSFIHSHLSSSSKNHSISASSSNNKPNNVQKAIQLYEGMSTIDLRKNKISKTSLKRDDSTSRKSFILRRNSRRSSLRKSRHLGDKDEPSSASKKKSDVQPKDDSGVVLSDGDDRTQGIYQTLSHVVNLSEECDPYDRLNRLHDAVNRIHKGQPSNCAACKAIPASVLQYRTTDSSFMQVKCNELAPHHHPPCICFSCQHSIFSCAENSDLSPTPKNDVDSLYYNVCCLNSPNRESWRQSRRRPVCEQNGRLCIVNCDMEKCPSNSGESKQDDEAYEKLSDCHSITTPNSQRDPSKPGSGDSCDSDEGWVDVTDSEDEKSLVAGRRDLSVNSGSICNSLPTRPTDLNLHNASYDLDHLVTKYMDLDLSRATSTEHLYESILDIDAQIEDSAKDLSHSSDVNPENDLDSGEWSTESASPTFDESPSKENLEAKGAALNQYRFTVSYESQETAKKTFMKSVLGGKKVVNTKKRRMSNFFVPWLVSNHEYSSSSKSPKMSLKKQNAHSQALSAKSMLCKNKRSQSVPTEPPKLSISCTKNVLSSSDLLEKLKPKETENEEGSSNMCLIPENTLSICSRVSDVSSAYVRSDQLPATEPTKNKSPTATENIIDCSSERVHKRSPSGNEHTYILFQPIKEEDVPLYQFYERNIKERVSFCRSPKSLSPIMWSASSDGCYSNDLAQKSVPSQLSVVEQLSPDAQDMKMLWCELPEVKESGILERISAQELKLQEAIFDLIQSEACYIRSLKVLYDNFIRVPEFSDFESTSCVLSKHEHDVLFSDIVRVKEVSERLLGELTTRWSDGILIPDICDIIHHNAVLPSFSVYVRYCSNRVYQERTLKELKETRLCFLEVLRKLESNPVCQGLSLESFLFLPMQHISRLPLLLDNIFRWLVPDSPSFGMCKSALEAVHKVFVQCNEGARKMERLEEMFVLTRQLEFKDCKVVPLISASRWLLKKGELMKLEFDKKTFGRSSRCVRVPIFIFLFNDLLVVTKRKSDDSYTVVDYCLREKVQAIPINAKELQLPVVVPNTCRYLMYLTLFKNHQGSAVDMIFNCSLLSERTRWLEAINGVQKKQSNEVWEYDYPQVQCVRSYVAQQPDELSLQDSDVVSITRKMNDGWYEGRRLRDGLEGWFPASYTMDIPCSRVRASNIRQCYRLLMLSQTQ